MSPPLKLSGYEFSGEPHFPSSTQICTKFSFASFWFFSILFLFLQKEVRFCRLLRQNWETKNKSLFAPICRENNVSCLCENDNLQAAKWLHLGVDLCACRQVPEGQAADSTVPAITWIFFWKERNVDTKNSQLFDLNWYEGLDWKEWLLNFLAPACTVAVSHCQDVCHFSTSTLGQRKGREPSHDTVRDHDTVTWQHNTHHTPSGLDPPPPWANPSPG